MSLYVVRNKERGPGTSRYLNQGFGGITSALFRDAHVFETLLSADIETEKYDTWRETRRLVWAVKWTDDEHWTHYLPAVKPPGRWGVERGQAKLFDSYEAACEAAYDWMPSASKGRIVIVRSTKAVAR